MDNTLLLWEPSVSKGTTTTSNKRRIFSFNCKYLVLYLASNKPRSIFKLFGWIFDWIESNMEYENPNLTAPATYHPLRRNSSVLRIRDELKGYSDPVTSRSQHGMNETQPVNYLPPLQQGPSKDSYNYQLMTRAVQERISRAEEEGNLRQSESIKVI